MTSREDTATNSNYGTCPLNDCGKRVQIKKNGTLRHHSKPAARHAPYLFCGGSGQLPLKDGSR